MLPDPLCRLAADSGTESGSKLKHSASASASASKPTGPVRQFRGTFHCLLTTFQTQGIRGVYAGAPVSIVGAVVYRGLHFGLYDTMKEMLSTAHSSSIVNRFLAAQVVSLAVGVFVYPLDTVRRRMMVQSQHTVSPLSSHCRAMR